MRFPTSAITLGFAVAGLCLAATASAADRNHEDAKALSGYTRTGATENCLRVTNIRSSEILNDHQILFKMSGGDAYLNEPKSCSGLNRSLALNYEVTGSDLCTTTIVKLVDPSSPVPLQGTCTLDAFQKLEKNEASAR